MDHNLRDFDKIFEYSELSSRFQTKSIIFRQKPLRLGPKLWDILTHFDETLRDFEYNIRDFDQNISNLVQNLRNIYQKFWDFTSIYNIWTNIFNPSGGIRGRVCIFYFLIQYCEFEQHLCLDFLVTRDPPPPRSPTVGGPLPPPPRLPRRPPSP